MDAKKVIYIKNWIECFDLIKLFVIFVLITILWSLFSPQGLGQLFGVGDTYGLIAHYVDLSRLRTVWAEDFIMTRTRFGGGFAGILDMPVLYQVFSILGLPAILFYNFYVILSQTILCFFSIKIFQNFFKEDERSFLLMLLLSLSFIYNGIIGWRVAFGHMNFIWGLIYVLAVMYVIQSSHLKQFSITGLILVCVSFSNALQCIGLAQFLYYSLILFLLSVLFFARDYLRKLEYKKLIFVSTAILIPVCLFSFHNLTNIFEGMSFLKRSGDSSLIYSYTVQNILDYFSSLFYSYKTIQTNREFGFLHETNYAFGVLPILLFSLLTYFRRWALLAFNIALIILGVLISSNISYLSELIVSLIPGMEMFRVPARVFIPIFYVQLFSFYFCLSKVRINDKKRFAALVFIGFFAISTFMYLLNFDILVIPIIAIWILFIYSKKFDYYAIGIGCFLAMNFSSFFEKIPEINMDQAGYDQMVETFHMETAPNLSHNYLENALPLYQTSFGANIGAIHGYSTVNGYLYPTKKFYDFFKYFNPNLNENNYYFALHPNLPGFSTFVHFFNITKLIEFNREGHYKIVNIKDSKEIFTPKKLVQVSSFPEMIDKLRQQNMQDYAYVAKENFFDISSSCADASVTKRTKFGVNINIEQDSGECIIVLPLLYNTFLRAIDVKTQKQYEVFPVNWLMTGVKITVGSATVEVRPWNKWKFEKLFKVLSLISFLLVCFLFIQLKLINFKFWKREDKSATIL